MIWVKRHRLPCILITVFTVLAVMVSFCLGAAEPLRNAGFGAEGTCSAGGGLDSFISSPAGEPALVIKTEDHQFASPQTGFQRIFNSCGIYGTDSAFYQLSWGINSAGNYYMDVKGTILLKLRI
jgi:hypothetical protein